MLIFVHSNTKCSSVSPTARCSPQGEGPLLVPAQSAAVDGGGAGHGIQMMGTVGQRGNPLTVPLCLLFPGGRQTQRD